MTSNPEQPLAPLPCFGPDHLALQARSVRFRIKAVKIRVTADALVHMLNVNQAQRAV